MNLEKESFDYKVEYDTITKHPVAIYIVTKNVLQRVVISKWVKAKEGVKLIEVFPDVGVEVRDCLEFKLCHPEECACFAHKKFLELEERTKEQKIK